ncbi:MAG: tRNA (adenosine(37)-N6)-threonylcarbamoyltransferase complex ATPase subunit type 1 TsaE [Clostridia bacterium]|nr:tRNA (adenosine(37)-N6)-threonylcarbamoyltransferase complex ATPase subunit type 1 TsaE [Clostridia bacterium]MBQ8862080.1 tRNA (adenosine(37)-N6)-threonylcarbamoyltransferase complex ATPase subunit type 1 TsaE [Clostridia bacterium]
MEKRMIFTQSTEETELAGQDFAMNLEKGDFVAMRGDLGVGKTAFIRGMAKCLAPKARVQSPTYQIVNEYRGAEFPFYHFDMYRIDDEDSLTSTGYFDYIENGVCAVEWSEKIEDFLPEEYYVVTILKRPDNVDSREIIIERVVQ